MKRTYQFSYLQILCFLLDLRIPNSQRTYEYHTTNKRRDRSPGITEKHKNTAFGSGAGSVCRHQGGQRKSEASTAVPGGGGKGAPIAGKDGIFRKSGGGGSGGAEAQADADAQRFPLCDAALHEALPRAGETAGEEHHSGGVCGVY